jgi:hypothetical protein
MLEMDIVQFAQASKIPLPLEFRQKYLNLQMTLAKWTQQYYSWLDEKNDAR